jgi:acylphosphatase
MDQPDKPKMNRAHLLISGRVQGVSFRWYTLDLAERLGLTGWVRNRWDGRVEAVFEGPAQTVQQAVAWCHHGRPPARVDHVDVSYETPTGEFETFRITG